MHVLLQSARETVKEGRAASTGTGTKAVADRWRESNVCKKVATQSDTGVNTRREGWGLGRGFPGLELGL